jgi:hypothetical protein
MIGGLEKEYAGNAAPPAWGKDGRFDVTVTLEDRESLLSGMKGEVILS